MKKICVFCGSSRGYSPVYSEYADRLGTYLAERGIGLVYGGGNVGLMGIVSSAVMNNGGHVTGVIPEKLYQKVPHEHISELIVVNDMHERKAMMYRLSDGFICLPGGIGSLEELLEVFTWVQLGYLTKPVCILNINGYYTPLLKQFEIMLQEGFLKESHHENLLIRTEINGITEEMFSLVINTGDKWI
ncbi:MAG TPA: TIGR00730 family Rossman fold protein [Spirochaetota bacterium]|nr:TIGR00730 family Rossman fold protein [Spirochaetota bacterium]HPF06397.1 TIGR00730 family Rossman fold protein [Spirochaetota bacterium]HPJ41860.1 TIGR00730 family Rossman fold protein [Spirochaetota bacterium]HPR36828.1 TIGR00730 family Rossman fold protein [Spirochaetota bacterium]